MTILRAAMPMSLFERLLCVQLEFSSTTAVLLQLVAQIGQQVSGKS